MEGRLRRGIRRTHAAGHPGQPVSISLAIIASLAARLLGINPQTWLVSTDPHENIERILAELKRSRSSMT